MVTVMESGLPIFLSASWLTYTFWIALFSSLALKRVTDFLGCASESSTTTLLGFGAMMLEPPWSIALLLQSTIPRRVCQGEFKISFGQKENRLGSKARSGSM